MPLFFVETNLSPHQIVELNAAQSHHVLKVLRHRQGDLLDVVGAIPQIYQARLLNDKKLAQLQILQPCPRSLMNIHPITVATSILPTNTLKWLVEKLTELGCENLYLMNLKFSGMAWKKLETERKTNQLKKSCEETLKQCERFKSLNIYFSPSLEDCVNLSLPYNRLFLWESSKPHTSFPELNLKTPTWIFVGPPGGWHEQELALLQKHEISSHWAGPGLMRVETAALYAVSLLKLKYEQH